MKKIDGNNEQNPKNQKEKIVVNSIATIMIIVIIVFMAPPIFFISLFALEDISENIQLNQEKKKVKNQAKQIATIKLKEKYPERNFEIIDILMDTYPGSFSSHPYVYKDRVECTIKENNEKYAVRVNTEDSTISDNIQENEIKNAFKEKLSEIIKIDIDANVQADINVYGEYKYSKYDFYKEEVNFQEKFNGDIIDFLKKEKKHSNSMIGELYICMVYVNGKEDFNLNESNCEFIELFDSVFLIDCKKISLLFKEHLSTPYLSTEHLSGESEEYVKNYLFENNIPLNSIYVYDKYIRNFKDII